MTKHPITIKDYESMKDLAHDVSNLRYDVLSDFLWELAEKIELDSKSDKERERFKLANELIKTSMDFRNSSNSIWKSWTICKPYIE